MSLQIAYIDQQVRKKKVSEDTRTFSKILVEKWMRKDLEDACRELNVDLEEAKILIGDTY